MCRNVINLNKTRLKQKVLANPGVHIPSRWCHTRLHAGGLCLYGEWNWHGVGVHEGDSCEPPAPSPCSGGSWAVIMPLYASSDTDEGSLWWRIPAAPVTWKSALGPRETHHSWLWQGCYCDWCTASHRTCYTYNFMEDSTVDYGDERLYHQFVVYSCEFLIGEADG